MKYHRVMHRYLMVALTSCMTLQGYSSWCPKLYTHSAENRIDLIADIASLTTEERDALGRSLPSEHIENQIGFFGVPLGIAPYFVVNGKEYMVPMATEERSVVAAASNGARMARVHGGISSHISRTYVVGQIIFHRVKDPQATVKHIQTRTHEIIRWANDHNASMVARGGGVRNVSVECHESYVIVQLYVDCCDAMGAHVTTRTCEYVAKHIVDDIDGELLMSIIANNGPTFVVKAQATFDKELLGGSQVVDRIIAAQRVALLNSSRCATHNKGVMNGIIAGALATGNDTRAVEAAVAIYAYGNKTPMPITRFEKTEDGHLHGTLEAPIPVGILGGAISHHKMARISLHILQVTSSHELACVLGAVGLCQNVSALRSLVTQGIERSFRVVSRSLETHHAQMPDEGACKNYHV